MSLNRFLFKSVLSLVTWVYHQKELWVSFKTLAKIWHVMTWFSFSSSRSSQGTNFVAIWCIFITFRMLWSDPSEFRIVLLTSQFLRTSSFTVSTFLSVLLTTDASSAQVTLLLLLGNYWEMCNSFIISNLIHNLINSTEFFYASKCFGRHPPIFRRSLLLIIQFCGLWCCHSETVDYCF
jgi:hypothetical protein